MRELSDENLHLSRQFDSHITLAAARVSPDTAQNTVQISEKTREHFEDLRQVNDFTHEEARELYQSLQELRQSIKQNRDSLREGKFLRDPLYQETAKAIRTALSDADSLLRELKALLDTFEGHHPKEIPAGMSSAWAGLLDHILLYQEVNARASHFPKRTSLEDVLGHDDD